MHAFTTSSERLPKIVPMFSFAHRVFREV